MFLSHFPAFKYRDFRLFWAAEFTSAVGTNILTVAIGWHLYELTHSPFALGLIGIFQGVPFLLLNLLGGNFADVHNRKHILYVTQPIIVATSLVLALGTFLHVISSILIYAMIALVWIAVAFDMPARGALLPTLVERKDLASANSTYTLLWEASNLVGPALGGFLIAAIGVGNIYFLDAVTTLFMVLAIYLIHQNGEPTGEKSEISLQAIKEGFVFLFSKEVLWTMKVLDAVSVLFASCIVLMPVFAKDILHVGPQGLGLLYAAPALGGVVMGIIMSRLITHLKQQGKIMLLAIAVYALATIVFGLSHSFVLSLLALFISGAGNIVNVVIRSTATQLLTPDTMMGRMSSLSAIFFVGGDKFGDLEGGLVAGLLGAPAAVTVGGIGALVVVGAMTILSKELRHYTYARHE